MFERQVQRRRQLVHLSERLLGIPMRPLPLELDLGISYVTQLGLLVILLLAVIAYFLHKRRVSSTSSTAERQPLKPEAGKNNP